MCGNRSKPLSNYEIGETLYKLLNRNTSYSVSFEQRYNEVYENYFTKTKNPNVYIPPTDLIAPNKISFNDRRFVMCDDKYYTFLIIDGNNYPTQAQCGWIDMFVNSYEGVDVDIYMKKKNKDKIKGDIQQTIGHTRSDVSEMTSTITDSYYNASTKYASAEWIFSCIMAGQNVYDISTMITVCGNTIEEVDKKAEDLIENAKNYDILLRYLPNQEEQAFVSSLPLNKLHSSIENKTKRNAPELTCSTLYPFNTFQTIYKNGVLIAMSSQSNSPFVPDVYDTSFAQNPHIFLCGSSGAGKTSTIELITLRMRIMGINVFIIAPEKQEDYRRLTEAIGGQFVLIETGSKDRINIMDIRDVKNEKRNLLETRISTVIEFISILAPNLTPKEKSVLNEALLKTYNRFGITSDNNSIWLDKENNDYKIIEVKRKIYTIP